MIREEGSNGDREMVASLLEGAFEVWDVNMQDLASKKITLDEFRGVVFVGGFSYADVCDSAKGEQGQSYILQVGYIESVVHQKGKLGLTGLLFTVFITKLLVGSFEVWDVNMQDLSSKKINKVRPSLNRIYFFQKLTYIILKFFKKEKAKF